MNADDRPRRGRSIARAAVVLALFTAAPAGAQLLAIPTANTAGEISKTLEGMGIVAGVLEDQKQVAETVRAQQDDRVEAAQTFQYSNTLGATATMSSLEIGAALSSAPARVARAQAGAYASSGITLAAPGGQTQAQQVAARFAERLRLFAVPSDPAAGGQIGAMQGADHMVGALLAIDILSTAADKDMAAWVVLNLTGTYDVPALTANQVATVGGRRLALLRGKIEAAINLARDTVTNILITDREDSIDNHVYNAAAAEIGLPAVNHNVSILAMRNLREVNRFTPAYFQQVANLSLPALIREWLGLRSQLLQQRSERAQIRRTMELIQNSSSALDATAELARMMDEARTQ